MYALKIFTVCLLDNLSGVPIKDYNSHDFCFLISDKMIGSQFLQGVPLLVLANKQDVTDCMGVREVKPIFNQNAHLIGRRDCMVMPISALTGFVFTCSSILF